MRNNPYQEYVRDQHNKLVFSKNETSEDETFTKRFTLWVESLNHCHHHILCRITTLRLLLTSLCSVPGIARRSLTGHGTTITPTVSPVPATTDPTLLVATSPRVISSPALDPVVTSSSLSPRVVPNYTPPLLHLISPKDDDPVPLRRYPLRSRPQLALSECEPHLISATVNFSAATDFPPNAHTGPLFAYAPRFFLAYKQYLESNAVIDEITGSSLEYRHLFRGPNKHVWIRVFANYLGRPAQVVGTRMPANMNILFSVPKSVIPMGHIVTYARLVATLFPHKSEVHRVRCTVGGDKLDSPGITTTNCASLTTSKILINITLSTPNARFLTLDIKDFYYNTHMARFEYMTLALDILTPEIFDQYNLRGLACPAGWLYLNIRKGMPSIK